MSDYLPYIGVDEITDGKKGGKFNLLKECSARNPDPYLLTDFKQIYIKI